VLMFEPGTGEALEIPATFRGLHESELPRFPNEALAREFFLEWARPNGEALPLALTECVGYRTPLFLGGVDEVENLEVSDLDIYWSIFGQLRREALEHPGGTRIDDVQIDD